MFLRRDSYYSVVCATGSMIANLYIAILVKEMYYIISQGSYSALSISIELPLRSLDQLFVKVNKTDRIIFPWHS